MNRKMFFKEICRCVLRSKSRFLAIFLIVALGSGFFVGMRVFGRNLKNTADRYYTEADLMDFRLVSTYGFALGDTELLSGMDGVRAVSAARTVDTYIDRGKETEKIVRISTYEESDVNRLTLTDGRMPQASDECVVSFYRQGKQIAELGDRIAVPAETEAVTERTLTVVGIVSSPMYIYYHQGSTTVGNGEVRGLVYVLPETMPGDYYTELFLTLDQTSGLYTYGEAYAQTIRDFESELYEKTEELAEVRVVSLGESLRRMLEEERAQLSDMREEQRIAVAFLETMKSMPLDGEDAAHRDAIVAAGELVVEQRDLKITEAEQTIVDAEEKIASLGTPTIYVFDRTDNPGYSTLAEDAERIDRIALVLPIFFVLVAMLVCLTTMTRMVEEERAHIGTLKALGYSNGDVILRYQIYVLVPTVLGCILGLSVGFTVLPRVLYRAYALLYSIPSIEAPFHADYLFLCLFVAVLVMAGSTAAAVLRAVLDRPALLMRPKPMKTGRRIFLEHIRPVWRRLSFMQKVTARNLGRYKKRAAMTVLGVAGCTALILTGLGLQGAIKAVVPVQFDEIFLYDAIGMLDDAPSEETLSAIAVSAAKSPELEDTIFAAQKTADIAGENGVKSAAVIVPEAPAALDRYVSLRDPESGELIELSPGTVVLTEKLARLIGAGVGDEIRISFGTELSAHATVGGIAENYALHYVYLSPGTYETLFFVEPSYNSVIALGSGEGAPIGETLLSVDGVFAVREIDSIRQDFSEMLENLNYIVLVVIVSAGLLAFVVLYNLTNINIAEHTRELATLKVLGFRRAQSAGYIYRENAVCTVLGILVGLVGGVFLERFVVATAEVDNVMFIADMAFSSYLFAALLTALFALCVNLAMYFKIARISMVESLKSVE